MKADRDNLRSLPGAAFRTGPPVLFLALFVVLAGVGCDDFESTSPDGTAMGEVVVHITDAPFPFDMIDSIMVTIDSLRVHYMTEDSTGTFLTIDRNEHRVLLSNLTNGATELLVSAEIPVGTIDQLRLHVSDASLTLDDGRNFELQVPSGSQSGVKVFPTEPVAIDDELMTDLLIDFDVSQSFKAIPAAPNRAEDIRNFQFHPVVRVDVQHAVGTLSGTVRSSVGTPETADDEPLQGASVTALRDGVDITTTATDEEGRYRLMGLRSGTYVLVAAATGFVADSLEAAAVAGSDVDGNDFRLEPDTTGVR